MTLAGCAATDDTATSPPQAFIPWEDRPLSAAVPEFAGKPFDFRCSACDIPGDYCWNLKYVERVIRVTGAVQEATGDTPACNTNNGHVFPGYCSVSVRVHFTQVEDVYSRPNDDSRPVDFVDTKFGYRGDERHVPRFLEPGESYYLFLVRSPNVQGASAGWRAFANCPRSKQSELSDALDAERTRQLSER